MATDYRRRLRDSPDDRHSSRKNRRTSSPEPKTRDLPSVPAFPSYLDDPDLPPKTRILCEIVARTPLPSLDSALDSCGVRILPEDVEMVLKLSYSHPSHALKFFRWSSSLLPHGHSPYSWNLVVDLLGKNALFDAMWDAVRSMCTDGLLSLATFASIFSSFAYHSRIDAALDAFRLLGSSEFPIPRDTAALNSLLSAFCRHGHSPRARSLLLSRTLGVAPDRDSFAIILEGCESDRDPVGALEAFSAMVDTVGWDIGNIPANDSFLCAIVHGPGGIREALKHLDVIRSRGCTPGLKFYRVALQEAVRIHEPEIGSMVWRIMTAPGSTCHPDVGMHNSMLVLLCYTGEIDRAFQLLDGMIANAIFPNGETYNLMLQFLVKGKKLRDAAVIFKEMVKNEFLPTSENCKLLFKAFHDQGDGEMLLKLWKCMVENDLGSLEESGNSLILKLRDLDMLPEAVKYAEEMVEKGVKVNSSTLSKLRGNLNKIGKGNLYDQLMRKWKLH